MSRRRRIAFWSGLGLLALLVMAISWLLTTDLGSFKPQIARWASEKTGRQVSIDGALNINLARQNSIVVENIRIGNPEWADTAEMLFVGRLEVRFDLRSLFSGPLLVELIDLDNVRLSLLESEQGEKNWLLFQQADVPPADPDAGKKGILFQQIDVDKLQLVYSSPRRAQTLQVDIDSFSQRHRDDDFLELALDGTVNGRRARIKGDLGNWTALLEQKNVRFDLDARVDSFAFSAAGHIDDLLRPSRPELRFTAAAPDINDLLQALGVNAEGSGAIDLSGSLQASEQQALVLDLRGQLGRATIEAAGRFSDLQDLEEMDLDLHATGDDIRPILAALGIQETRESPFMVKLDAQRLGKILVVEKAEILFGEARLNLVARIPEFPALDEANIHLTISGPDIEHFRSMFTLPGAATGAFALGFSIDVDDDIEIVNLDLQSSLLQMQANGSLGQAPDYFGTTLNFRLASDSLRDTASAYGIDRLPDEPVEIEGGIEYTADGIRIQKTLEATIRDVNVSADGLIKPVRGALGSELDFTLNGANLRALVSTFASGKYVPAQPYQLGGQLQVLREGYRLQGVHGSVGTSGIRADGLLVANRSIVGSGFDFSATGPAFEELIDHIGDVSVIPGPYELGGRIEFKPDTLDLKDFQLRRAGGDVDLNFESGRPASRRWANFELRAQGPDVRSLLRNTRRFAADEAPFSIDVQGERRGTDWTFRKLDVGIGAATLTASGDLDLSGDDAATRFDLQVMVPNVAALGTVDGRRPLEQALALQAHVRGRGPVLEIDDMVATLGPSAIKANLRYRIAATPELFVDIDSSSIVFAPWFEALDKEQIPPIDIADGRFIPDIEIPFSTMQKFNAEIEVDIAALQKDQLQFRDVSLRGSLRDGALEVTELGLQARSGVLAGRAQLLPGESSGSATLQLVARDFAPGVASINQDLGMKADLDINLESTGNDLRTLLGNASGVVFTSTRGGRMGDNKTMQRLYGDVADQILGAINPFRKTATYTDFECIVIPLEIANGTVKSAPSSLLSTDQIRVLSTSVVDLKTEKIEMNIRTTPKKGITISAGEVLNPYLKIVGTLAAPRLAVDEKGVLVSGGVAVATGGLSILARAAWDRLSRSDDACDEASNEGRKALADRLPQLKVSTWSESAAAGRGS